MALNTTSVRGGVISKICDLTSLFSSNGLYSLLPTFSVVLLIYLVPSGESIQDGSVAQYTPHTAFDDPTTPEGTPFRQSIEIRALVFYD